MQICKAQHAVMSSSERIVQRENQRHSGLWMTKLLEGLSEIERF